MKRKLTFLVKATAAIAIIACFWIVFQFISITLIGEKEEIVEADTIIVLGAAVWPQGPSPALQARVYRSWQLYQDGLASTLLVSGGLGINPPTEAEAMAQVAQELGVAADDIVLEPNATTTWENLVYSKQIMEEKGFNNALVVTDAFHMKRTKLMAKDLGMEIYAVPAKNSVLYKNTGLRLQYTLREVAALSQYYLLRLLG